MREACEKALAIALGVILVEGFVYIFLRRNKKVATKKKVLAEAFFFPDEDQEAVEPQKLRTTTPSVIGRSGRRILEVLQGAKKSVDICQFQFSNTALGKAVLDIAAQRKVLVRLITDWRSTGEDGAEVHMQVGYLRRAGVAVRTNRDQVELSLTKGMMHHKFVVVDGAILINGSINWTRSSFSKNMEDVIITDIPDLVEPYKVEFQRLWKLFEFEKSTQETE